MPKLTIKHDDAHDLPFGERDRSLLSKQWPNMAGLDATWTKSRRFGCPQRKLELEPADTGKSKKDEPTILLESILRFPSAPVFATHEARQHVYKVEEHWPNFHTMRVLTRKDLSKTGARHVFLLHNGLNETRDISFHYRLASWILSERENAACIIRPLPAHLNRCFFQSPFTELPLDEYLQDPASVFRQFLRYMLETQWLLSTLVPRPDYEIMTGCELLLYDKKDGRTDAEALADEIKRQANRTLLASKARSEETGQSDRTYSRQLLRKKDVLDCIVTLRSILGWSAADPAAPLGPEQEVDSPAIHAVGYSMGGFVAQSVFCAWPFAVASCSNLFAGGALRDLAPTAFAHPEEWQSVLHGLRSELDHARVQGRLSPLPPDSDPKYVVGIKKRTFDYVERVFENVFLQSDRGSYSTRLAEFSRRLLFILGGDDPIVRTRNVLDAAPPGGITMHQIGDVSHFQHSKHKEPAELEQRDFWLPEAGRMIGRFADRASILLQQTNSKYWRSVKREAKPEAAQSTGRQGHPKRPADGGLANMQFERELDLMLTMIATRGGWLFIARNQVPTVFLEARAFRAHAAAMHHSEDLIGEYVDGLTARAKRLETLKDGFSLLIPSAQVLGEGGNSDGAIKLADTDRDRAMFSKSEVAIRYWPNERSRRRAWEYFTTNWCGNKAVHRVMMNEYSPDQLGELGEEWAKEHKNGANQIAVTMLPDVWIAMDKAACDELFDMNMDKYAGDVAKLRSQMEDGMVDFACKLAAKRKIEEKGKNPPDQKLQEFLTMGSVRVVKVSPAEFNPRYRGRLLDGSSRETGGAGSLMIHWAMAYKASRPVTPIEVTPNP